MNTALAHEPAAMVIALALRVVARATTPAPRPGRRHRAQKRDGCPGELSGLPCLNPAPHPGDGRGCVHHSTSGVPDRHDTGENDG